MRLTLCLLTAALLCGCGKLPWNKENAKEDEALAAVKEGDYPKAVRLYEEVLAVPSRSGAVHYQLAIIYEERLGDPVSALHHYRRSIKMGTPDADKARAGVKRMEARVASRYASPRPPEKPTAPPHSAAPSHPAATPVPPKATAVTPKATAVPPTDKKGFSRNPATAKAEQNIGAETKTHTVEKGDTLVNLSRKYYKTPDRWKDIADANQNRLGGSTNLQPGMVLIIP